MKAHIESSIEPKEDDDGKLKAEMTFDDDILAMLEIVTIFLKFRDCYPESRVYENYKKEIDPDRSPERSLILTYLQ